MRRHRLAAPVVALLTLAALASSGIAPAQAAPLHHTDAANRLAPTTHETSKVILPETSIDGPALSSVFQPNSPSNRSVIAWTGTDPAHHLNVETSADGLHFDHKLTLSQTSPFRPDVTQAAGGAIALAWTGSDPNHLLNVLYDVYGSPKKLTLTDENSISAPAITLLGAYLFLAWTGTDPNHSLNLLPIAYSASSLVPGKKIILSQFSSDAGPHLARRGANSLVLEWTSRTRHLTLAFHPDVTPVQAVTSVQTSAFAPETSSLEPYIGVSGREWIGWTGTDPAHHLNLQWTTTFPEFTNAASTKTVLGELAIGGPALGYNAGEQIAWTGADPAHHLNIAKYTFS